MNQYPQGTWRPEESKLQIREVPTQTKPAKTETNNPAATGRNPWWLWLFVLLDCALVMFLFFTYLSQAEEQTAIQEIAMCAYVLVFTIVPFIFFYGLDKIIRR